MIVDPKTRRVSNREGLVLMECLDHLDDTHDQIENDLGSRKITIDRPVDEFREYGNVSDRIANEFREQRNVSERLLNEVREQREVSDRLSKESKVQKIIKDHFAKEPKTMEKWWFLYRATQIEFASSNTDEGMNPGNIIEDLEILEFVKIERPERYDSLREGFEFMYEVSLQYKDQIIGAPELITKTFDKIGDTKSCWGWYNNPATEKERRNLCRTTLSNWLESVNAAEGDYPKDEIKGEFEKLVRFRSI